MALGQLQRDICQLLAAQRRSSGESYVAGGVALNELTRGTRRSRDIDLFHDTAEALVKSWDADRAALQDAGLEVRVVRERPTFVEVIARRGDEAVIIEWSQDSAFRFFPLVEHPELGLTLHPVDLATNKVLALVGRREARDFVDVVRCDEVLQPLGYLAWAAAGKDPGFSPLAILGEASKSVRYSQPELDALDFEGGPPDAAALAARWHELLARAREVVTLLPTEHAGRCVLDPTGALLQATPAELGLALAQGAVLFHSGRIKGSFPRVSEAPRGR